jgi:lysozyme family protein
LRVVLADGARRFARCRRVTPAQLAHTRGFARARVSIDPGTASQRPHTNRIAPLVDQAMACGAERDEVVGVVGAAIRTGLDVVHVEEACAPATGGATMVAIARQDFTAYGRRDGCVVLLALPMHAGIAERGLQGLGGHR